MCTPVGLRYAHLAFALLMFQGQSATGNEQAPPFISGFDRFARHGDIADDVAGRLLLSELSCTACHATKITSLRPKFGPSLDGVGNRLQRDWLKRFLATPDTIKPGATMPDMLSALADDEKARAIEALVAFLSAQHVPFPELKASGANPVPHEFWHHGDRKRGQQLYHQIGCVACHQPDKSYEGGRGPNSRINDLLKQLEPDEIETLGLAAAARPVRSVPLGPLKLKYTHKSLTFFLLNPESIRPGGRMPSLKLNPVEAADIAAFLIGGQPINSHQTVGTPLEQISRSALQAEGRRLFGSMKCVNCHTVNGAPAKQFAKPLAKLDADASTACFGVPAVAGLPHFPLNRVQSDSIKSALSQLEDANQARSISAHQEVELRLLQLNCYACHQRNKRGGIGLQRISFFETVGHVDLGDEGRIPPPLTGVGSKLHKTWMNKVFDGTGDIRPHMLARMPQFPQAAVADLPDLLVRVDGPKQPSEAEVFGDHSGLAQPGRTLLDAGCVLCHITRGESPPGVVGVDLAGIANRVYPKWFHDFLLDPEQLKHGTRMPTFFPGGKSSRPDVLDGNVDRQIAAMWDYLKNIENMPLPEKVVQARSQAYELIPEQRPIVLRTFMKHAGTHAIAVGFPEKVHIAFDAENVRLSQAWRGRFLDAYGTWFVRSAPPANPLGVDLAFMPAGLPLALLKDRQQPWPSGESEDSGYQFMGYRLDRSGTPTFFYRVAQFEIEDRIEPDERKGLVRRLRINRPGATKTPGTTLWFRIHVGKSLQRHEAFSYSNENGLTVTLAEAADRLSTLRKINVQAEWILPVEIDRQAAIEVRYQW